VRESGWRLGRNERQAEIVEGHSESPSSAYYNIRLVFASAFIVSCEHAFVLGATMGFEVDFLAVGEGEKSGDAIVVRWGDLAGQRAEQKVLIIDGGTLEAGKNLVNHVQNYYGTTYVDAVLCTHPDIDHACGLKVVLEELDFALSRGASIYAEVLGYGAASEALGMRKGDIDGTVMASAIRAAINNAGLSPTDVDHINAHGSSLPDFDACDVNAFKKSLGSHAYRIPITSIKSMLGQPVSAAGGFQAAAACLSIAHQRVPPTINQDIADPQCDLDFVPNHSRIARINHVLINGHSFGGSVSALVIGKPRNIA